MQIEQDLRGRCGQLMASALDSEFRGLGSRSCRVILLCSWANRGYMGTSKISGSVKKC